MLPEQKLDALLARHNAVESDLARQVAPEIYIKLSREFAELGPIVETVRSYRGVVAEIEGIEALIADPATDSEMRAMAAAEKPQLEHRRAALEQEIKLALLPKDAMDERNVIPEIRGRGAFARLKFESGVHRVQRVPDTEASGRIHTSTATVAVLPEAAEVDIAINEADLKIDTLRSGGAGGQHVNKTESAVRVTHIPTGIVVMMQEDRSQHRNRAKAMAVLRARLYDFERQKRDAERAAERRGQVGSGDRSERIRTYNFPQGRVTDHRINLTLHKLPQVIEGEALGEIIDALVTEHQAELLAAEGAPS